jgi:hypothetical protein
VIGQHALAGLLPWLAAAAAITAAGLYLKWALLPVALAFRFGRRAERICRKLRGSAS